MAFIGRVTIRASRDVRKLLTELAPKVVRKHMRPALRAGAKVIQAEAQLRAPELTGALKKSIKVRAGKAKRKWAAVMLVQTRDGDFQGDEFYGMIVHQGVPEDRIQKKTGRNVGKVEAMPYMGDAFEAKRDEAEGIIAAKLEEGILSEVR